MPGNVEVPWVTYAFLSSNGSSAGLLLVFPHSTETISGSSRAAEAAPPLPTAPELAALPSPWQAQARAPRCVESYQGTRIIFYSSVQIIYYIKITFLKNEYFGNNSGSPAEAFFKVP